MRLLLAGPIGVVVAVAAVAAAITGKAASRATPSRATPSRAAAISYGGVVHQAPVRRSQRFFFPTRLPSFRPNPIFFANALRRAA